MGEPIENEYFNWLCAKVLPMDAHIYYDLLRILHQTPFEVRTRMDRNRAEDGVELRVDFLKASRWICDPDWYTEECSVFEMLYALSLRANFQTDMPAREWFWIFLRNLCLEDYRQVSHTDVRRIEKILRTLNRRTYHPSGGGGLFPLRWPERDQRNLEIWHQFCDYLQDQGLL